MPTESKTFRRVSCVHSGQVVSESSLKLWYCSKRCPQFLQA